MRLDDIESDIEEVRNNIAHAYNWYNDNRSDLWVSLPIGESEGPIDALEKEHNLEIEKEGKELERLNEEWISLDDRLSAFGL